jgi:hypothetical protein
VASVVSEASASSIWVSPAAVRSLRRFAGIGLAGVGLGMAAAHPGNGLQGTTPGVDRVLDPIIGSGEDLRPVVLFKDEGGP